MSRTGISDRITSVLDLSSPFFRFLSSSNWASRGGAPDACDFVFGNPHEMPLPGFVAALQEAVVPRNKDWFAYKENEPLSRETVAASLCQWRGLSFEPEDIFLTNGGFAALAVTLALVVNPGDEVVFISPPWFFYESLIATYGGKPVPVKMDLETFDLDLDAIEAALSERTSAIIVNSPHNPSGKIYPPETLAGLARLLTAASERNGRPVFILSDEAYSRIVFDGRKYISPTEFYPNTFLLYTYGKTLLTPGQRMGYIALPPSMPDRPSMRDAVMASQVVTGFAFPNALLQHALPALEGLSIDIGHFQHKRDLLVQELRGMGYELAVPEGTFYLLVRSPLADDMAFTGMLEEYNVFCLPGAVFELPGYFRISLTANDEMIERALPAFRAAMQQARSLSPGVGVEGSGKAAGRF